MQSGVRSNGRPRHFSLKPPYADEPLSRERRREIFTLFLRYLAIFDFRVHVDRGNDAEGVRS